MAAAPMVSEMKRQVPFDRQMDLDCAREKRNDAQRKAHEKTEKIKIRPGHNSPRTRHFSATFRCAARAGMRAAHPPYTAPAQLRSSDDWLPPSRPSFAIDRKSTRLNSSH